MAPAGDSCLIDNATKYSRFREQMRDHAKDLLDEHKARAQARIDDLIQMETLWQGDALYTCNDHYLAENVRKYTAHVQKLVTTHARPSYTDEQRETLKTLLAMSGITMEQVEGIPRGHSCDDEAIAVVAGALAYFRVAFKAFSDGLFKHVRYHMLDMPAKSFEDEMNERLCLLKGGPASLSHLFKEDVAAAEHRRTCTANLKRQTEGLHTVDEYLSNRHVRPATNMEPEPEAATVPEPESQPLANGSR